MPPEAEKNRAAALDNNAFSYSEPGDPFFKRLAIRGIERLTGQPYMRWLYEQYRARPRPGEPFFDASVRLLELAVSCDPAPLAAWPKTGPLVVVCNHPFGVLDGMVSCKIVAQVRPDLKILTNAVLYRAEELRPYLLPIDFTETRQATGTNLASRAAALAHLRAGGCMIVFPSGAVSTTPSLWETRAVDPPWKTFAAKLIIESQAAVAPVFFAGQNSRLFQIVSHFSLTLRLAMLFWEVHNKIGSEIRARAGRAVPYAALKGGRDRLALTRELRAMTYALGEGLENPPPPPFKRPRRVPRPSDGVPDFS